MNQSGDNILSLKMCHCGRAPLRRSGKNCHYCNREAGKRYRLGVKNMVARSSSKKMDREGRVYFVQEAGEGAIKIGHSINLEMRLAELRIGARHPLTLMGSFPARMAIERVLHERFAAHRIRGEWFRPAQELISFIAEVCAPNTCGKGANTG